MPDVAALEASSVHSYLPGASRGGEEVREGTRHTLDPVLGRYLTIKPIQPSPKLPLFLRFSFAQLDYSGYNCLSLSIIVISIIVISIISHKYD